jgi:hypothetical protein
MRLGHSAVNAHRAQGHRPRSRRFGIDPLAWAVHGAARLYATKCGERPRNLAVR